MKINVENHSSGDTQLQGVLRRDALPQFASILSFSLPHAHVHYIYISAHQSLRQSYADSRFVPRGTFLLHFLILLGIRVRTLNPQGVEGVEENFLRLGSTP